MDRVLVYHSLHLIFLSQDLANLHTMVLWINLSTQYH